MGVVANSMANLAHLERVSNSAGMIVDVVEIQTQAIPQYYDGPAFQCNERNRHLTVMRGEIPKVTRDSYYLYVKPTQGNYRQTYETTGKLISWMKMDTAIIYDIPEGGRAKFLKQEADGHFLALAHHIAKDIWYGDPLVDPLQFLGFEPRYNSLTEANGNQIFDAGGVGNDLASIWVIGWGEMASHFIYPKGKNLGVSHKAWASDISEKDEGQLETHKERFRQCFGLAVRDWRANVRIANIDVSEVKDDPTESGTRLSDLLIKALGRLKHATAPRSVKRIYMTRDMHTRLQVQSKYEKNLFFMYNSPDFGEMMHWNNIPIRWCDQLLETEARVV